ncbi:hypothetical protein FNV43_RR10464 [Rhamnella rubrinervis]|uniref:F-box/LRR-repeat protein 15/At3g58940/PEG3-like LRR domain-containing protein n=1 Tax=Rhamnella rubrinervis TaxID=2594499 RepID=A0A8K0HCQ4_9ROSA|nr:hypothetical protein FNV43_RR10464 [Rhamnella rubrinervis]
METPDTFIRSFKLQTHYKFRPNVVQQIDNWVDFVIQSKVKELNLCCEQYRLPHYVLNASSLTLLRLTDLNLEVPSLSTLTSLKVLYLESVKIDDKSFQNLISGCPIIEDLHLDGFTFGDIDLAVSGTLKNLSLRHMNCIDQWLKGVISRLPVLEKLTLYSYRMSNVSIHSNSLKSLFFYLSSRIDVTLRTPNLVCLDFGCYSNSIISIDAPNLVEAGLTLGDVSMKKSEFDGLVRFLSNLNCLKKMKLSVFSEQVLIFPKVVRKRNCPPLSNLKHLVVVIHTELTRKSELLDALLWCAPSVKTPEIISQKKSPNRLRWYVLGHRIGTFVTY